MLKGLLTVAMVLVTVFVARAEWRFPGEDRNPQRYQSTTVGVEHMNADTLGNTMALTYHSPPLVYDVDGDAVYELVVTAADKLYVYDENLSIQAELEIVNILSEPFIYNVNTTSSVYEVNLVCNDSGVPAYNSYEVVNGTVNLRGSFNLSDPGGDWYSLSGAVVKDASESRLAVLSAGRFQTYSRAGVIDVNVAFGESDTLRSNVYTSIGGGTGDIYGDWDNDGDSDFCFWHDYRIMCVDELGNTDLDYNTSGKHGAVSGSVFYRDIVFLDYDGGSMEIATTTGSTGWGESWLFSVDSVGNDVFSPVNWDCPGLAGDPDAGLSNPIGFDVISGGGAQYNNDELLVWRNGDDDCAGTSDKSLMLLAYNENGLIDSYDTLIEDANNEIECMSVSRGTIDNVGLDFVVVFDGFYRYVTLDLSPSLDSIYNVSVVNSTMNEGNAIGEDVYRWVWADVNNDGVSDLVNNDQGILLSDYINLMPDLMGFDVDTGSPICIDNVMTYSVLSDDYIDSEGDDVALNVDCYGNTSLGGWSDFGSSPTRQCNYTQVGSYEPIVYLTDTKHIGLLTEYVVWVSGVTVTVADCFESGVGGVSVEDEGYTVSGNWSDYGVPLNMTEFKRVGPDGYDAKYFDWDGTGCSDWTWFRGLCPFMKWVGQLVFDLWAWFWGYFLFIVLIGLFIIFLVLVLAYTVRRSRGGN